MRYRFHILILMAISWAFTSCNHDDQPSTAGRFMKFYGTGLVDYAYDIQQMAEGDYIIAGYTENSTSKREAYAIRVNQFGDLIWENTYGATGLSAEFKKVKIYEDGLVFVGSYEDTLVSKGRDMYIVKTSFDGEVIWEHTHGGVEDQEANDFGTMPNGDLIMAGSSTKANNVTVGNAGGSNPAGVKDFYIIRITSEGDSVLNTYQAGGENDDEIREIVVDWAGYIYASGVLNYRFTFANLDNDNVAIIAVNTQGGKFDVDDNYGFGSLGNDVCSGILLNEGGLILAGNTDGFSRSFINRIPSTGNLRQIDSSLTNGLSGVEGVDNFILRDVKKNGSGGFIVAGESDGMMLINLDSEGNVLWSRIDADLNGLNNGEAVIPTIEGGFAVVGNAGFGVDGDIMLLKVNSEGRL